MKFINKDKKIIEKNANEELKKYKNFHSKKNNSLTTKNSTENK